ncbi:MAG: hypothetical protein A2Y17_13280 [Clostridiales bacterium GWF2_38_85]|nr:MAG: hypothetical protein A2Y17_13280 [Clostridiales bacterium GWF2_38_85]
MKKKTIIISASTLVLVAVILTSLMLRHPQIEPPQQETSSTIETSSVSPVVPEVTSSTTSTPTPSQTDNPSLNVDVKAGVTDSPSNGENGGNKATASVDQKPKPTTSSNGGGINIGGEAPATDNSETNAFIASLEAQGCPYCGKHDCVSFYTKDEWNNPCYNPKKCPQYDKHEDPLYYCQDCGKPIGDGTNGTCSPKISGSDCGCTDLDCDHYCRNIG